MSTDETTTDETTDNQAPEPTWPRVVKLKHPIEFGDERIASLEFRRGRLSFAKGLKVDDVPPIDDLIKIASRMCGQPTHVIEKLDVEDAGAVMEIALVFFASCLSAGR